VASAALLPCRSGGLWNATGIFGDRPPYRHTAIPPAEASLLPARPILGAMVLVGLCYGALDNLTVLVPLSAALSYD
jgi:hypothetical protein